MSEPRPLTEQELVDWERWSKRDIAWKGSDVARLIATVRWLQAELASRPPVEPIGYNQPPPANETDPIEP